MKLLIIELINKFCSHLWMNIISGICIIGCLLMIYRFIIGMCRCENKTQYFNNFKKGKCLYIYFISLPLYFIGYYYASGEIILSFFNAVKSNVELVVLKYDLDGVMRLLSECSIYRTALYLCFSLVLVNAVLVVVAMLYEKFVISVKMHLFYRKDDKVLILIGNNEDNIHIAESTNLKTLILSENESKEKYYLCKNNILCSSKKYTMLEDLLARVNQLPEREVTIIINTGNNSSNFVYANNVLNFIKSNDKSELDHYNKGVECYVFSDDYNKLLLQSIEDSSFRAIKVINKYSIIANQLCFEYPASRFLSDNQVDREIGVVKDGVEINHCFIGFGKTSRAIFNVAFFNDQMLQKSNGEIKNMQINYNMFDISDALNGIEFCNGYKRYEGKFGDACHLDGYYPLVGKCASVNFHKCNVNSESFYKDFEKHLILNPCGLNLVTISLGNEIKNIDMCEKIYARAYNSGINIRFMIKIDNYKTKKAVEDRFKAVGLCGVVFFGVKESIYTYDGVASELVECMAIFRHMLYMNKKLNIEESIKNSDNLMQIASDYWRYEFDRVKRASNKYALLNVRSKLNLLGFDISMKESAIDCAEQFKNVYFNRNNLLQAREAIAMQEHARWNSYMISNGYIPASKEEYFEAAKCASVDGNLKKQLLRNKKHINITTFDGLKEFQKDSIEKLNKTEDDADVIKYDYQVLDSICEILEKFNCKIIKLENSKMDEICEK